MGVDENDTHWSSRFGMRFTKVPTVSFERWRESAIMLAQFATNHGEGRPDGDNDRTFIDITQNLHEISRREGWFYSSCAHYILWIYRCLNVQSKRLELTAEPDNPLSRIAFHPLSTSMYNKAPSIIGPGDVVHIGSNGDSHVLMCTAIRRIDSEPVWKMRIANGGQGLPKDLQEAFKGMILDNSAAYPRIGNRPVRHVLKLETLWRQYTPTHMWLPSVLVDENALPC